MDGMLGAVVRALVVRRARLGVTQFVEQTNQTAHGRGLMRVGAAVAAAFRVVGETLDELSQSGLAVVAAALVSMLAVSVLTVLGVFTALGGEVQNETRQRRVLVVGGVVDQVSHSGALRVTRLRVVSDLGEQVSQSVMAALRAVATAFLRVVDLRQQLSQGRGALRVLSRLDHVGQHSRESRVLTVAVVLGRQVVHETSQRGRRRGLMMRRGLVVRALRVSEVAEEGSQSVLTVLAVVRVGGEGMHHVGER